MSSQTHKEQKFLAFYEFENFCQEQAKFLGGIRPLNIAQNKFFVNGKTMRLERVFILRNTLDKRENLWETARFANQGGPITRRLLPMGAARKIVVQFPPESWQLKPGDKVFQVSNFHYTTCRCCRGQGGFTLRARDGPNPFPCEFCNGYGQKPLNHEGPVYSALTLYLYQRACPCHGEGDTSCYCAGHGVVLVDQTGKPYWLGFPDSHPVLQEQYRSWEDCLQDLAVMGRYGLPAWEGLHDEE